MKKKRTIKVKSARRWLARNRWDIARFVIGVSGHHPRSRWVQQLFMCRRIVGDVRFRSFS
jgi:hypothetical protein